MGKIVLSMFGLIFSVSAFADMSDIVASDNQFIFQAISTNVDYTETGNGIFGTTTEILDMETGPVPGIALSASTMRGAGNTYIQGEFDVSKGYTNYTGSFITGGAFGSVIATSTATMINFNVRLGKGFSVQDQLMLTPYAELGHHEWDRGVNYGEIYSHYYWGIGVLGQYSPISKLVLSGNAMLGRTFKSYITVDGGPDFSGLSGALGSSTLYKVGASADYAFTKQFHGNIAVDYTGFKYGMSAVYPVVVNGMNTVAWEPGSKTKYTTIKIGAGYAF